MAKKYTDSFVLWMDIQRGLLDAQPVEGYNHIWKITDHAGDFWYTFTDEAEQIHTAKFPTPADAIKGLKRYAETELGVDVI